MTPNISTFHTTMKKNKSLKRRYSKIVVGDNYVLLTPLQRFGRTNQFRGALPKAVTIISKNLTGKNRLKYPLIVTDWSTKGTMFLSYYKLKTYYTKAPNSVRGMVNASGVEL